MLKRKELFEKLTLAKGELEFNELLNGISREASYEEVSALGDFLRHSTIRENQIAVIEKIAKLKEIPAFGSHLIELTYFNNSEINESIIGAIEKLGSPMFAYRLYFIYLNTSNQSTKRRVLRYLLDTGVHVFSRLLLLKIERDSFDTRLGVLHYLAATPVITEEHILLLEKSIPLLIEQAKGGTQIRRILSCLHLIHLKRKINYKIIQKALDKSDIKSAALYNFSQLFKNSYEVIPGKIPSDFEDRVLVPEEHPALYSSFYGAETRAKLVVKLPAIFQSIRHDSVQVTCLLEFLIPVSGEDVVSFIFEELVSVPNYNTKGVILNYLPYLEGGVAISEPLFEYLCQLLGDEEHVRIFDSITKVMMVMFRERGLAKIAERYGHLSDANHKTHMLHGVNRSIVLFGYGKSLTNLDQYYLQLILANTFEFLLDDVSAKESRLFHEVCRFLNFTPNDTFSTEFFSILDKYPVNEDLFRAAINQGREDGLSFVVRYLKNFSEAPRSNSFLALNALSALDHAPLIIVNRLQLEEWFVNYLRDDLFATLAISILIKNNNFSFESILLEDYQNRTPAVHHSILQYLGAKAVPNADIVFELFQSSAVAYVKLKAALILIQSTNHDAIEYVYDFYFNQSRNIDAVIYLVHKMERRADVVGVNYRVLSQYQNHPSFSYIIEAISHLSTDIFMLVTNAKRMESHPLQDDAEKNIDSFKKNVSSEIYNILYTAEKLYQDYNRSHLDSKAHIDIESAFAEYCKASGIALCEIIAPKLTLLFRNNTYQKGLQTLFSDGERIITFFKTQGLWRNLKFDVNIINEIRTSIVTGTTNDLLELLSSIKYIVHLLSMTLLENSFYSIENPLSLPIDFFVQNRIPERLAPLCVDYKNKTTEEKEKLLVEVRFHSLAVINFLIDYKKIYGDDVRSENLSMI